MVNPARAGMILSTTTIRPVNLSKPRASGDDPRRRNVLWGLTT